MPLTDTTTATLEKGSEPTNQRAGDFFVQANRRYVVPYFVDLKMNCKGKWFGRTVLNVFQEDFPFQPSAYFARAVKVGRLFAVRKGKTLPATELLKNGDVVCHKVHRHEPSVPESCIHIIKTDGPIVVVSKGGVPIHSSGRYRRNTLVNILGIEPYNLPNLLPVHRLDRVTTGVCLLARTPAAARKIADEIAANRNSTKSPQIEEAGKRQKVSSQQARSRSKSVAQGERKGVRKEYIAKVRGVFPDEARCDLPLSLHKKTRDAVVDRGPKGKPSTTLFRRLATSRESDTTFSIVLALPLTGRTHQIRIHLQAMGHPIVDDPLYNHLSEGNQDAQVDPDESPKEQVSCRQRTSHRHQGQASVHAEREVKCSPEVVDNECCAHCPWVEPSDTASEHRGLGRECFVDTICLHALAYSNWPHWCYEDKADNLPSWITNHVSPSTLSELSRERRGDSMQNDAEGRGE